MNFVDVSLSSWVPNINAHLFRPSPRDPLDRDMIYEDRFDATTIIYDGFWSEDATEVILICPPIEHLKGGVFKDGSIHEVPSGRQCHADITVTGPVHILRIPVSPETRGLQLVFPLGNYYVAPQPNLCSQLKDERLLVTHNKNNPLHWIRDWAYFHVKMHGCTGVLFYDNGSDKYSKYDVRAALETVPGLKHAVLVDAPFPFGAQNGPQGKNDSRYFQRAYLEHAKYRIFNQAASILHIDIDELVVSPERRNVFEAVERSQTGCISFEGVWVERATVDGIEPPVPQLCHAGFRHIAAGGGRKSLRKTGIAPQRVGHKAVVTTHRVYGVEADHEMGHHFKHRHFMGLKTRDTNPKNAARLDAEPFEKVTAETHEVDPALESQLQEVFGSEEYRGMPAVEPYAPALDADVCRRLAGARVARGDHYGAIDWVSKAIKLKPGYPSYFQFLARSYEAIGKTEEAQAALKQAQHLLKASPEYIVAAVRKLRQAREFDKAFEEIQEAIELFPDNAEALIEYGEMLIRTGRRDDADRAFQRATELSPDDSWVQWRYGHFLHRSQRYSEATEYFERALTAVRPGFSDRVKAYTSLILALEADGRHNDALEIAYEALERLREQHRHKMTVSVRRGFEELIARLSASRAGQPTDGEKMVG